MATADYYYPDWECLVDFFCNPGLQNCWHGQPGIEPTTTTLYISSQSGAYDLSATAGFLGQASSAILREVKPPYIAPLHPLLMCNP